MLCPHQSQSVFTHWTQSFRIQARLGTEQATSYYQNQCWIINQLANQLLLIKVQGFSFNKSWCVWRCRMKNCLHLVRASLLMAGSVIWTHYPYVSAPRKGQQQFGSWIEGDYVASHNLRYRNWLSIMQFIIISAITVKNRSDIHTWHSNTYAFPPYLIRYVVIHWNAYWKSKCTLCCDILN